MKFTRNLAAALAMSLLGASAAICAPPFIGGGASTEAEAGVKWLDNLQTAHKLAIAQNKPILIVFGADWCGYCKKLEKETLGTKEVSAYINDTFIAVHLDFDKEKRVTELLEVKALPCSVIVNSNAELLGRIDGYKAVSPYQEQLLAAQRQFRAVQTAGQAPAPR